MIQFIPSTTSVDASPPHPSPSSETPGPASQVPAIVRNGTQCLWILCCLGFAAPGVAQSGKSVAVEKAAGEVKVDWIDAKGFKAAVAKHKGKVVLVDCWATWCVPCIKGFPETVSLSRKHAAKGLVVISLSFDDPEDEETPAKVFKFLKKQQAAFPNYISRLDLDQGGSEAFGIEGGSLPHYKLYDRSGKLLKTFSNSDPDREFSHEMLVEAVEAALK